MCQNIVKVKKQLQTGVTKGYVIVSAQLDLSNDAAFDTVSILVILISHVTPFLPYFVP